MSSPLDGYGARAQTRSETRRLEFGSPIHRLKDATDYIAQIRVAGLADVEKLDLEGGVSLLEFNPVVLDKLPLDCPLSVGDYFLFPHDGDAQDDRYRVVSRQDKTIQGTTVKRTAVAIYDPDRS